eukprot:scaffold54174_cov18-Tisochrysis_lutea.AAC.2
MRQEAELKAHKNCWAGASVAPLQVVVPLPTGMTRHVSAACLTSHIGWISIQLGSPASVTCRDFIVGPNRR